MRLKLYRATGMAEAMRRVREELGVDALILSTRRVADGVEVTAGLEPAEAPPPPALADPARMQALGWHAVPAAIARKLQAGPLPFALSVALRFERLALAVGAAPLLLVGPPGAGKTLTCARLATRLVMSGVMPMVITADGRRAGATEQLAAFTRLLGINLLVASQPASLARALARRRDGAPVLIDGPGTDAFDRVQRDEMAALAAACGAGMALVLPAGLDAAESAELAEAHAQSGARLLVATRLDTARRLGGVLAAAGAGLALAEAGIGAGAADGLTPMTPELLADRLIQCPVRLEPPK
ncbi:MAG: GTP-binding protein [Rhodospirillales bacterium]|nr:GTP-binding protein [Rhodospirillales bacterium]